MLGRVLDEAAAAQEQRHAAATTTSESESLLPTQQQYSNHTTNTCTSSASTSNDPPSSSQSQKQPKPRRHTMTTTYGALGPRHHPQPHDPFSPEVEDPDAYDPDEDNETYAEEDSDEEDEEGAQHHRDNNKNKCCGICSQIWKCLRYMADVEDLWDSPNPIQLEDDGPHHHHHHANSGLPLVSSSSATSANQQNDHSPHQKNWIVAFWFLVLATSYAVERSTFKFLVDEAGPFRLFSVEMITATHATLLGCGMLVAYWVRRKQCNSSSSNIGGYHDPTHGSTIDLPLGLPIVDVGLMALLDVASLMLVFLTGYYVSPALTVILVQFTLPLTGFFMQFVHSQGRFACCRPNNDDHDDNNDSNHPNTDRNTPPPPPPPPTSRSSPATPGSNSSNHDPRRMLSRGSSGRSSTQGTPISKCAGLAAEHVCGSALIVLACLLALVPAIYTIIDPDFFLYADPIPLRVAYNTLFYISACIPAAVSQLYKEHVFLQYKQPVNVHKLNLLLSVFEFTFVSILSPLVFTLQGVGSETQAWYTLYPSSLFSDNFFDGLLCFFGVLSKQDQNEKYPERAHCEYIWILTLGHALSIIFVGLAVDKIVSAGASKVTHRGISAGIILAVICMAIYDFHIPEFNYGPFVDALNLVCLVFLILGSEIYHRVTLEESTFETVYQTMENIYDED